MREERGERRNDNPALAGNPVTSREPRVTWPVTGQIREIRGRKKM